MRLQRSLGFAFAFCLGLAGGCFDEAEPGDSDGCPGGPGCECGSNDDCDGDVVCEGGFCNEDECKSFADCPADAPTCVKGLCEPCNASADACPNGTHCDAGMCVND